MDVGLFFLNFIYVRICTCRYAYKYKSVCMYIGHCQVVVRVAQLEGAVSNQDNDNDNNGIVCPMFSCFCVKL